MLTTPSSPSAMNACEDWGVCDARTRARALCQQGANLRRERKSIFSPRSPSLLSDEAHWQNRRESLMFEDTLPVGSSRTASRAGKILASSRGNRMKKCWGTRSCKL